MNEQIKVSVIIPTYNDSKHIVSAIESVLSQSFKEIDIIVIDDGSTDDTKIILDKYIKSNKIIYIYQDNGGQSSARGKGVKISKAEYLAFIDSDDEWINKDKLKLQVSFLNENNDYAMVGTNGIIVDENKIRIMEYSVPESNQSIRNNILLKNPFIQSSVLIRRNIFDKVISLLECENIRGNEDYSLWLRVGLFGKFFNLTECMTMYTAREGNTSSKRKIVVLKNNISLIYKHKKDYPNYKKALIFSYFKFFLYSIIDLIFNKKVKVKITNFLYQKYRKIEFKD
jgi:glycosyltransferase involved in cell wall biosynthesis